MAVTYISFMTNDVEYLLICLFAIHISSFFCKVTLQLFYPFLKYLILFTYLAVPGLRCDMGDPVS